MSIVASLGVKIFADTSEFYEPLKEVSAQLDDITKGTSKTAASTLELAGAQTLSANASAEQIKQYIMASSGLAALDMEAAALQTQIAGLTTGAGLSAAAIGALGAGAVVAAAGIGAVGALVADATMHYFQHSEATRDSREELERLKDTYGIFQDVIGRAVLGEEFSLVKPLRLMREWLIRVGAQLGADIQLYKEFANLASGGLFGAGLAAAGLTSGGPTGELQRPLGSLLPHYSESEKMALGITDPSSLYGEFDVGKAMADAKKAAKKLAEFNRWLADGPVPWGEGLSGLPGQQLRIPGMPAPPLPHLPGMTSGVTGSLPASATINWGTPAQYAEAVAPPPGMFEALAEKMKLQSAPSFTEVGLFGARGLIEAIGMGIGSGNWSGVGASLMSSLAGAISAGVNLLLPGLGTLLGPLIGGLTGLLGGLFDRHKGRDQVVAFAESMGGFDALHNKLLQLGQDGEALWVKLTQGTPSGNKDIAMQNIAAVQQALNGMNQAGSMATDGLLNDLGKVPSVAQAAAGSLSAVEQAAKSMGGAVGGFGGGGGGLWNPRASWEIQHPGEPYPGLASEISKGGLWNPRASWEIQHPGEPYPGFTSQITDVGESQSGTTINVGTVYGSVDANFVNSIFKTVAQGGNTYTQARAAIGVK